MNDFGVVILEGNIGAGKSSLAKLLAAELEGEFIPEPADGDNPFLELYYKDPARWSYTMQTHLLSCRYRAHLYAQAKALYMRAGWAVMDRSYFGDSCFANVQKKLGLFSEAEYESYYHLHKDMQAGLLYPTAAIFLKTSPQTSAARISKRMTENTGRACESAIDLDYLKLLDAEIDALAAELKARGVPVLILDWDQDLSHEALATAAKGIAGLIREMAKEHAPSWLGLAAPGA